MSGNNWAWQNSGNGSSGTLASGSNSVGTPNTLFTGAGQNTWFVSIDLTNMANSDIVDITIKRIINSTARVMAEGIYANVQARPLVTFGPFAGNGTASGIVVILNQTAGTARGFDWEVLADSGVAPVNLIDIAGSAVSTTTAQLGVNIVGYASGEDPATLVLGATAASWNTSNTIGNKINSAGSADPWSTALPGAYTSGEAGYIVGNYLTGAVALASGVNVTKWNGTTVATPATAGVPDINVKNMNNVAATSITAINANQGTTQPVNFSGTGSSAFVKSDTEQLNAQTVTAAAGVTFPSSVASPTNITAGTITTATNLTNAPTAGDFTATMKTSLGTAVAASAVASVTGNVGGNVTGSVGSISGVTFPTHFSSMALNASGQVALDGTTSLTESYAAQGAALTVAQALYGINQFLGQHSTSGTVWTIKKRDGSTAAKTFNLDSATAPTSLSEAT